MADIWMDVDAALAEVPVNIMPLLDDTDFKTRETAIAYNQAGMDLVWNFVTTAGAYTQTAVTPTTGGNYDWAHQGDGMYSIEIPASGGASINNDTEGFGWFTGICTGVLAWRGPIIGFRASGLNDLMIDSAYSATRGLAGTALPAAAADAAGGLPISDAGGLDLDAKVGALTYTVANKVDANTTHFAGQTITCSGGVTVPAATLASSTNITAGTITTVSGNVNGNVGGNVTGSVGSVVGAVGSVTGAVGSVTGNVGGNVVGSVGSVTGAVGSVTGAVGSVTGNVGGNVVGSVGSVTGAVGSVTGNVGGNVTGSVGSLATQAKADVNAECDTALTDYDPPTRTEATSDKAEILTQLPSSPLKNTQFTYVIKMVDATDGMTPETGLTVTMTRSLDGAAFGAATGSVTEISTGHYKVVASAADMNGDLVAHRFTATGAQDFTATFLTVS